MTVAVWAGAAPPRGSIDWLDGVLGLASKLRGRDDRPSARHAIAAGNASWLDLVADRAVRAGLGSIGIETDLRLGAFAAAHVAAAVIKTLDVSLVLVDEASRRERVADVCAIAELLGWVQLTAVGAIEVEGSRVIATRHANGQEYVVEIDGPAVLGMRVVVPPQGEHATPLPSKTMRRSSLASLALSPSVLANDALPPGAVIPPLQPLERVADHLRYHLVISDLDRGHG